MSILGYSRNIGPWRNDSRLKRGLLLVVLSLALIGVGILGALRLLHNFSGSTISAWRLVLLFGNAFFCVTIACALYARGRRDRRWRNIDVGGSR